jgi:3-hydroxyisobutyrate dehydrogenase-like beta-hydroxyacid dehydrogenase
VSTEDRKNTVGFVGLGMMGAPMAENILKNGYRLVVYDIDAGKVRDLGNLGAQAAAGPADVARRAGILICMVETTAQVEEVILGPGGFIETAQRGDLVISMSTIDMMALRKMHPKLAAKGIDLIDAPVTGMRDKGGAKTASLKCYVGGDAAAVERARPILLTMTSEVTHFGAIGQGIAMKVVNNMLLQVNRIVVAEALALGAKAGLDPQQMIETVSKTTGNSVAFQYTAPRVLARDFDGIRMDITAKDVELQTALGKSLGMPMIMASAAQQVYQMGKAIGLGDQDGAAIVQVYERWTGVPVVPRS